MLEGNLLEKLCTHSLTDILFWSTTLIDCTLISALIQIKQSLNTLYTNKQRHNFEGACFTEPYAFIVQRALQDLMLQLRTKWTTATQNSHSQ